MDARVQWPVTVLDVPVEGLQGKSFQWWVAQLPVKHGGLLLRNQSYLSKVSYLGSVELCLPSFAGPQGICSNLAHLVGEEESKETRWAPPLASGSRLGEEFIAAWTSIRTEAEQLSAFVEEDLPAVFSTEASGFGDGAAFGTRRRAVEARETLLAAAVGKALSLCEDQSSLAVRAWKNRDKLTTAFLLELPGPHNQWSPAEWGEALCLILSVPPNCCRDPRNLGRPIGNRHVDLWGSDVLCVNVAGGGWTRRHDRVKCCISSLGVYCGVAFVCEPYSLFTFHLPQRPLHRLQAHQARQALRPDFLFHLPNSAGNLEQEIADVQLYLLATKSYISQGCRETRQ